MANRKRVLLIAAIAALFGAVASPLHAMLFSIPAPPPPALSGRQTIVPTLGFLDTTGKRQTIVPGEGFINEN